jgi:hypothetical protein
LLGYKRKTANAFRAARVINKSYGTPNDMMRRRRAEAREKRLEILEFAAFAAANDVRSDCARITL